MPLTHGEAKAAEKVMEGTVFISRCTARCLFYSGSSHSFVSPSFARHIPDSPTPKEIVLLITTPLGASIDTNLIYKNCTIMVGDRELPAYLILLKMSDFGIILCMD